MPTGTAPSLATFIGLTIVGNGSLYLLVGGAIHHYFYGRNAATASEWRLQPERPMPTRAEVLRRIPGVLPNIVIFNAVVGATFWAIATGHSRVVFDTATYGAPLLLATALLPTVIFHGMAFAVHRAFHTPFLFRHVHSVHHRARTPIFVDALAMHPFEAAYSAAVLVAPAFLIPLHIWAFALYFAVVGMHEFLDHSGVRMRFPLLSPSSQHDEHHRSVRRYYGQALPWLDAAFGTDRPGPGAG